MPLVCPGIRPIIRDGLPEGGETCQCIVRVGLLSPLAGSHQLPFSRRVSEESA